MKALFSRWTSYVLEKLFTKRTVEGIESTIYKNGLDSEICFQTQRLLLEKKCSQYSVDHSLPISKEIEINKFKETIINPSLAAKYSFREFHVIANIPKPSYLEGLVRWEKLNPAKAESGKDKKGKSGSESQSPSRKERIKSKKEIQKTPILHNWYVGDDSIESLLASKLSSVHITSLLLLSDDAYTRQLIGYRKLISVLMENNIEYYEYTNLQPNLSKTSLNKVISYALDRRVNSILVFGSASLLDFSKLVIKKLVKPNSIKIVSSSNKPVVSSYYSIFSVPTLVLPNPKLNEKFTLFFKEPSTLKLQPYSPSNRWLYLFNFIDSSDYVFYYPSLFLEYTREKQMEGLHQLFFKLFFLYFDSHISTQERLKLLRELKSIEWYLDYLHRKAELSSLDSKIIMLISARSSDGRYFISNSTYWTWYRLGANLTALTSIPFSHSLALFLPSFLEYIVLHSRESHDRAVEIAHLMYGFVSTEGLLNALLSHIKKYSLPMKFFDIPGLKEVDKKFICSLIRGASPYLSSYKMVKTIIQNLAIW